MFSMVRNELIWKSGVVLSVFLCAVSVPGVASAEDVAHGWRVFGLCAQCHSLAPNVNVFGPSLKGVAGRKAAAAPNYQYSTAMKDAAAAGLVWDDQSLAQFLSSPSKKVPGTRMSFWGLWSDTDIKDVIAFLKTNP